MEANESGHRTDPSVPGKISQGCSQQVSPSFTWDQPMQQKCLLHYPAGRRDRSPICPVTAPPKQQMNKYRALSPLPCANLTSKAMEMQTLARVYTKYSPLGTAKLALHLCPDRAMGNIELVQKCNEPAWLCEYRLLQQLSPNTRLWEQHG